MNRETFSLSQKELQRVAVISACIKGEVACARAAELLCLSVRQIKRLKKRLREDGEAALAHASRGRPSLRRLPVRMRDRYPASRSHPLCRFQRSSSLREASRGGRLLTRSGDSPPSAPPERSRFPQETARSYAPPATSLPRSGGRNAPFRWQPSSLARRSRPTTHPPRLPGRRHAQGSRCRVLSHGRCSRVFSSAASLATSLRHPSQLLWGQAWRLRTQ